MPAPPLAPRLVAALAALLLPAALGCPGCGVPPPANALTDPAAMRTLLETSARAVETLRAETRAEQTTERGPMRGTVWIFLRRPDRLRFDSLSPVDTPLAVLVSDGTDFALHDVEANRFYFGPADPCNIARLLRIPLDAEAVIRILTGLPPALPEARGELAWSGDGWYVYRQVRPDGAVLEAHLAPWAGGPVLDTLRVRFRVGERTVWEAEFDDWAPAGETRLPRHLRFTAEGADGPVEVWYQDVDVNPELPDDAWTYPAPEGIPAEEVTCTVGPGEEPLR